MNWIFASLAAAAVFLIAAPLTRTSLTERVGSYLVPPRQVLAEPPQPDRNMLAGLSWSPSEARVRQAMVALAGGLLGLFLAQGDLFVNGTTRTAPGLVTIGTLAGALFFRVWMTQRIEQRRQTLIEELPLLADALALQIMAGESVVKSIENLVQGGAGVGVSELRSILDDYQAGDALTEALIGAGVYTVNPEAKRLYETLANGHHTGSRLADDLNGLAVDYRARLERDLITEGGRRAIAIYAPILALMVPVTLVFLVYPALAGLRSLAGNQ